MPTTRIDIINRAVVALGQSPVVEDVPPGDSYVLQYETHINALVSSYPWTFQIGLKHLSRLTASPTAHWTYAYDLPAEMDGVPKAVYPSRTCREPTTAFEIQGRQLLTDHPEIWLAFTGVVDPARWPAYFVELAVTVMMKAFALSIREDVALWRYYDELIYGPAAMEREGGMLGRAKAIDASGKASDVLPIGSNPLTSVRFT